MFASRLAQYLPRSLQRRLRKLLLRGHVEERDILEDYFSDREGPDNVMLDVGAHFGTSLGPFARKGFRVFAFEPDPNNRKLLMQAVATMPNVTVDVRAVSKVDGAEVAFFTSSVSTGISGLSAFHASHRETGRVKTVRLDTYCKEQDVRKIDLLKIDTEGFDLFVLESLDWDQLHPEVILCEFEDAKTEPLGYRLSDLSTFLVDRGYALLVSEWYPVVEYGRRHRHRRFLTDPKRVATNKAWGNILAFPPERLSLMLRLAASLAQVDPDD